MNDNGVTKLLNHNYIIYNIVHLSIIILSSCFIIYYLFKEQKKKRSNADKIWTVVINLLVVFIIIFMTWFALSIISNRKQVDVNDSTISTNTIVKKRETSGRHGSCYVTLKGISEEIIVNSAEYLVYLKENDNVYVVYDKKNNRIEILSPKHYKYIGNKLTESQKEIYVKSIENNYQSRYYLRSGILFIIISILCLIIFLSQGRKNKKIKSHVN